MSYYSFHVDFPRTHDVGSFTSLSFDWLTRAWVLSSAQKGMEGSGRGEQGAS